MSNPTTIEPLHTRIRSGQTRPGDDLRFAKELGISPEEPARLALCTEALSGSIHAALELWRAVLPDRPLRIQVTHTPSALKMCAHLLAEHRAH